MTRLASIVFIASLAAVLYFYSSQTDPGLDCARRTFCEIMAYRGDVRAVERILPHVRLPENLEGASSALVLAKRVADKDASIGAAGLKADGGLLDEMTLCAFVKNSICGTDEAEKRIPDMKFPGLKALSYAYLAREYLSRGEEQKYRLCMKKAYYSIYRESPVLYWDASVEIIGIMDDADRPDGTLMRFFDLCRGFRDFRFVVIGAFRYENTKKYLLAQYRKVEKGSPLFYALAPISANSGRKSMDAFENVNIYIARPFYMAYPFLRARENSDDGRYKYPMLAYVSDCNGWKDFYRHYRDESCSALQMNEMRAGYPEYVEYAVKAFALCGDSNAVEGLITSLPRGTLRNSILKKSIRWILERSPDPDKFEEFVSEELERD